MTTSDTKPLDFIRARITDDLAAGRNDGRVVTRFPPEPSGYLHIGHAKALCLNFGVAREFGGVCHLRFDDTNPAKEEAEYEEAIKQDIAWLGWDWDDKLFHASSYYEQLFDFAVQLIRMGKAYVDSLSAEQIREYRGTLTEPGRESPHRDRSVEENLDLFMRMKAGEFDEGDHLLRAKIDMASPNINLRDPALYRIRKMSHHRTGDTWCIYPMYDFAHGLSDAIEGVTHSLCSLEFENHRPLYEWFLEQLQTPCRPQQIEFARLEVESVVTSKRKLKILVDEGHVAGWDDPRMPTLAGLRRRGYSPAAIRAFCDKVGVAKRENLVEMALLEHCVREDLNKTANRVMGVVRPLKVVIENFPEGEVDLLDAINNPEDPNAGARQVPFTRELYIEREDFMEDPPRKFHRLGPGREVRLRYAYFVTCTDVIKDEAGEVVELRCTYDPETRGGDAPDGRKVKGTMHWVSATEGLPAEVRLYDRLFTPDDPGRAEGDIIEHLNPESLEVVPDAVVEPYCGTLEAGTTVQFERVGYFCVDPETTSSRLVVNRTVTLREGRKIAAQR